MNLSRVIALLSLFLVLVIAGCRTGNLQKHNTQFTTDIPPVIDAHNHLFAGKGSDYSEAARTAVATMKALGIDRMIIMPPPASPENQGLFKMSELLGVRETYPARFILMGGGGSLNVMLHQNRARASIPADIQKEFENIAVGIISQGAKGFGEMSIEHFSFSKTHPYESVRADHPLLLQLADIAARFDVPVDIHMEAVSRDIPFPHSKFLDRSGSNPADLKENISGFERLLSHNRNTRIIWSHAGWCNTGHRTVALNRRLLENHPNLYMSIKLSSESVKELRPMAKNGNAIKRDWLALMSQFPDRFIIGTDQFYSGTGGKRIGPQRTEKMIQFINLLPQDLARHICVENPKMLFDLD